MLRRLAGFNVHIYPDFVNGRPGNYYDAQADSQDRALAA